MAISPLRFCMKRFFCLIVLMLIAGSVSAADLSGSVRVVDGDTLAIGDTRIRLWGIDAPEIKQTCQGRDGQTYECGRDNADVMRELTLDRTVERDTRDRDRYGPVV